MSNRSIDDEILELIEIKTEGDYWDFKEQWHENNADLLHDIICMANNLADRDAYIIIGISDSKSPDGVQVKGVPVAFRKNQQNLIDFLKDKKFAGSLRPTVYVQTIQLFDKEVDVIIVKNSKKTPFFLVEAFNCGRECVRTGHIYVRIGDTNTPKPSFADIDKIEYLWRKRLGIDLTVNERLLLLLDDPDEWLGSLDVDKHKYHSVYPEFQIHLIELDDDDQDFSGNSIINNLADHLPNRTFSVSKMTITYHSTEIYSRNVIYLDGGRIMIPFPETDSVYIGDRHEIKRSLTYLYYDLSTIIGKLFACLAQNSQNWYSENWKYNPGVAFLVFSDKLEQEAFNTFTDEHLGELLDDYNAALKDKGYSQSAETAEYYQFGWSKANEIKSWYLYDQFRGRNREIGYYLPSFGRN